MKLINIILRSVGAILLLWFALPLLTHGILNVGNIIGMLFGILIIIYGTFFTSVNKLIVKFRQHVFGKITLLLFTLIFFAAFVLFAVISVNIAASSLPNDSSDTTVVVLGCRVRDDGPSLMLSERINAAYRYLTDNPDKKCILSGGKGSDEPISEAECMYNSLVNMGIAPDRLIVEDKSTSTYENLLFSKQIISEQNLCERITVITNDFHMYRAMLLSEKLEIKAFRYHAKTNIMFYPTYFVREICGVLYYYLFGLK